MRTRRAVGSLARLFRYRAVRLPWSTSTCAGSSRRSRASGWGIRSTTPAAGPPPPPPPPTVRRGEPAGCRAVGLTDHHRHRTPGGMDALVTLHGQEAGGGTALQDTLFGTQLQSMSAFG